MSPFLWLFFLVPLVSCRGSGEDLTHQGMMLFPCKKDQDCDNLLSSKQATCQGEICVCHNADNTTTPCKAKTPSNEGNVGGPCPCRIEHTFCQQKTNVCECVANFTKSANGKNCVLERVPLGKACEDHGQCIKYDKHAVCDTKEHICSCDKNFVRVNNVCHSKATVGDTCSDDKQCQEQHSKCIDRYCACENGFVSSHDKRTCLPGANLGSACTETVQCQLTVGSGATCDNELCVCSANHHKYTNESGYSSCQRIVVIGDGCEKDNDCFSINVTEQVFLCRNGHCACKDGYVGHDGTTCVPKSKAATLGSFYSYPILCSFFLILYSIY